MCDLLFHLQYYSYPVCILINASIIARISWCHFPPATRSLKSGDRSAFWDVWGRSLIHPARSGGGVNLGSAKNPTPNRLEKKKNELAILKKLAFCWPIAGFNGNTNIEDVYIFHGKKWGYISAIALMIVYRRVLPWNLTWNLKMEVWKMIFLFREGCFLGSSH